MHSVTISEYSLVPHTTGISTLSTDARVDAFLTSRTLCAKIWLADSSVSFGSTVSLGSLGRFMNVSDWQWRRSSLGR